jgi:uncharacterized membrane protein
MRTRKVNFASPPRQLDDSPLYITGAVPVLILYVLSTATSIHVFILRYQLVAVPGIALAWALVASLIDSRTLRLLCSPAMVAVMASISFTSKRARSHETSWKAALAFVEEQAVVRLRAGGSWTALYCRAGDRNGPLTG